MASYFHFPGFTGFFRPAIPQRLIDVATDILPSTLTMRRVAMPRLQGATRTEIRDLVDLYKLPRSLNIAQIRAIIAEHEADLGTTTASWIPSSQGNLVLACRHGLSPSSNRFVLPSGRAVAWDKPTYFGVPNNELDSKNPWRLAVVQTKRGAAVDSVGDIALLKSITGPTIPTPIPVAEAAPKVGDEIARIGKNGAVMNGKVTNTTLGATTERPLFPKERPLTPELKNEHEELVLSTDSTPGDSGGPILNTNNEIGGITNKLSLPHSNAIPIFDPRTGKVVEYATLPGQVLSSNVGIGTSSNDINRLLERHDLR